MAGKVALTRLFNMGNFNNVKYEVTFEDVIDDPLDTELIEKLYMLYEVVAEKSWIKYGFLREAVNNKNDLKLALEALDAEKESLKLEIKQLLKGE